MGVKSMSASEQVAPQYFAPHHIRIAVTPTGAVALDLKRNRYLGLGMTHARELATLAMNWSQISTETEGFEPLPTAPADSRIEPLLKTGLLTREPPEATFTTTRIDLTEQLTSVGLQQQSAATMRVGYIASFVRACLWSKQALRSRTLYSVACEISAAKAQVSRSVSLERTIELVCIFRRLRPYAFEAHDRCLFHALALWRFLFLYDSHANWVIGVCARPWAAHSWLQADNCVLDSSPEDVCTFTPILAI